MKRLIHAKYNPIIDENLEKLNKDELNKYKIWQYIVDKNGQAYKIPDEGESKKITINNFIMFYDYQYRLVFIYDNDSNFKTSFQITPDEWFNENEKTLDFCFKEAEYELKCYE